MIDKNGTEIKIGQMASVDNNGIVGFGKVSQIYNDTYAEIQVQGKTIQECGVDIPFTIGGNSEQIEVTKVEIND